MVYFCVVDELPVLCDIARFHTCVKISCRPSISRWKSLEIKAVERTICCATTTEMATHIGTAGHHCHHHSWKFYQLLDMYWHCLTCCSYKCFLCENIKQCIGGNTVGYHCMLMDFSTNWRWYSVNFRLYLLVLLTFLELKPDYPT